MVVVGVTCFWFPKVKVPTPWSIVSDVALVIFQIRYVDPPEDIVLGLAVKLFITGNPTVPIVTVAVAVTVP